MVGATPSTLCNTPSGGYQEWWEQPLVPCVVPLVVGIRDGGGWALGHASHQPDTDAGPHGDA